MRIKHFAGYGSVNAKKIKYEIVNNKTVLIVRVSGDHERGLRPFILEDTIKWLAARFDKNIINIPWYNVNISYNYDYSFNNPEALIYTFIY